jgi:ABC-type Mn2+/Zn2+ transport system permease subunit
MSALTDAITLFGAAFVASLVVAVSCALLGVHVVARRMIPVGVALPQMAALGIACSFLVAGVHAEEANPLRHDLAALLLEGIGVAILAWGGRNRSVPQDALAGVVFVAAGALTILLMMRSAQGLDEVRNLVEGNVLAVHRPELVRLALVLGPVVLLHVLGGRRFLFCSFDRETAATLGIRSGWWDAAFYATMALAIAAGVHATGTLFVFGFFVLPGAAGIVFGRSAGGVFGTAVAVAVVASAVGFVLSYEWDTPTGPMCVGMATALFVLCCVAARLRDRFFAS